MSLRRAFATAAVVAAAAAPGAAGAASIFGSLSNFDAVNDTGRTAHGFEIDLEGLHLNDVTDTFGGAGRGFPTDVERYGAPTVSEYNTGGHFGVSVVYRADLSGAADTWVGTPTGVYNTPGESCWTGGGLGYGPSTPCDHFGVGLAANPTNVTYDWLVEDTPGSSSLVKAASNVPAPTWTVTPAPPPAPGQPAPPPVVAAQIEAPDPVAGAQWGDALWVKVFTTEFADQVDLYELVGGNARVDQAEQNTEIEWQLLQKEFGNPNSGLLENDGGGPVGDGAESVLRRYEFYKYAGLYDGEGEARPLFGDTRPGDGELGAFIGAQNAALNFFAAGGGGGGGQAVPEPATWALMIIGFAGAGAGLRRRRPIGA